MTALSGFAVSIQELYWVVLSGNTPMFRTSAFLSKAQQHEQPSGRELHLLAFAGHLIVRTLPTRVVFVASDLEQVMRCENNRQDCNG